MRNTTVSLLPALGFLVVGVQFVFPFTKLETEQEREVEELSTIILTPVERVGGLPLVEALARRHSTREFSREALPLPVLSELLWAADGVNRPDGKRTAPSARNRKAVETYVVLQEGTYRYDPDDHRLIPVVAGDLRSLTGTQDFPATAPLNLVYVADLNRLNGGGSPETETLITMGVEAGHIAQNVYLYCASKGLGAVTRMSIPREQLAEALRLGPSQYVISAQTVGYAVGTE